MKNRIIKFVLLWKYRIVMVLLDIFFINLALYLSFVLLQGSASPISAHICVTILWIFISSLSLLYASYRYSIKYIIFAIFAWWFSLTVINFYLNMPNIGKSALLLLLPLMFAFILGYRMLLRGARFIFMHKRNMKDVAVVILGVGERAREITEKLKKNNSCNYKVVGFLSLEGPGREDMRVPAEMILGKTGDLYRIAREKNVSNVIIAFSEDIPFLHKKIEKIMKESSESEINFKIVPDLYDLLVGRLKISYVTGYPFLDILPKVDHSKYLIFKRVTDIFISMIGLIIFSPVMLAIAAALHFYEKGPVFYKQERVGESNRPFVLYKFRSMVPDAEKETGPVWAKDNDPRVTPLGRFLRRNSLDELPQLWNVLKGDMGIIGPRPERAHFINNHKELQGKRLNIRPGITGLAQINGRYKLNARQKSKYDYIYLKNYSFTLDMIILFKTLEVILNKSGAR